MQDLEDVASTEGGKAPAFDSALGGVHIEQREKREGPDAEPPAVPNQQLAATVSKAVGYLRNQVSTLRLHSVRCDKAAMAFT